MRHAEDVERFFKKVITRMDITLITKELDDDLERKSRADDLGVFDCLRHLSERLACRDRDKLVERERIGRLYDAEVEECSECADDDEDDERAAIRVEVPAFAKPPEQSVAFVEEFFQFLFGGFHGSERST